MAAVAQANIRIGRLLRPLESPARHGMRLDFGFAIRGAAMYGVRIRALACLARARLGLLQDIAEFGSKDARRARASMHIRTIATKQATMAMGTVRFFNAQRGFRLHPAGRWRQGCVRPYRRG
jgi:hypothetical protein